MPLTKKDAGYVIRRSEKITSDGSYELTEMTLMREILMEIRINGVFAGNLSCTPLDMEELTAGWLQTEGYIGKVSQIGKMEILEDQGLIEVSLAQTGSGESDGTEGVDSTPDGGEQPGQTKKKVFWSGADLAEIHRLFMKEPPLYARTHAAHSCMVLRHGSEQETMEVLFRSEDTSRHGALDKAIGWALLHDVDLGECLLFISGRTSTRMAAKAGRAGVCALAGLGAVTAEAADLANKYDMALIGDVKADSAVWFSGDPGSVPDEDSDVT